MKTKCDELGLVDNSDMNPGGYDQKATSRYPQPTHASRCRASSHSSAAGVRTSVERSGRCSGNCACMDNALLVYS